MRTCNHCGAEVWVSVSFIPAPPSVSYAPTAPLAPHFVAPRSWLMAVPCGHSLDGAPADVVKAFSAKLPGLIEKHRPPPVH